MKISLIFHARIRLNLHRELKRLAMMQNEKTFAEENDQVITNKVIRDADGEVIAEDITCETSTRLPVLKLAANDELMTRNRARA